MERNSNLLPIDAHLILLSIRTQHNRYRYYRIRIQTINLLASFYLLTLSWGRLHQPPRHRRISCSNPEELYKLLQSVLRTRQRHEYQILERSPDFPELEILKELEQCELPHQQLTLFEQD